MKDDAQASTSIWMATANTSSQARLSENIPLNYLEGLARAIMRDGVRLFSGTHATKIEGRTCVSRAGEQRS